MKKLLILTALIAAFMGFSANAAELSDTKNYNFEREIITLQSLGIVNGDENNMFRPTELLKRSEASKLMVTAFGFDGTKYPQTETEFNDVPKSHWASGYIQSAFDSGFINGYGDGNFGADDEITLVQACTMLVKALGYTPFAEMSGGYPTGYLIYASDLKFTEKLNMALNDPLTKGEFAYMLAEVMEAPMVEFNGSYLNIMHGRGADYLCPMIHYHNAYSVNGMITATERSGGLPKNQADLKVNFARRLGAEYIPSPTTIRCTVSDKDDINSVLFMNGEFILQETPDGDYKILLIVI